MDDDLFTCEVKIPKVSYSLSVEQQMNDLDNRSLDVYEWKLCYDECEKMYAEAVIFVNKILVRLIDVTMNQWIDLKYGDHMMVSNEVKVSVISTWLIQSYKKQFDEYMEIKKQNEVYGLDTGFKFINSIPFSIQSSICLKHNLPLQPRWENDPEKLFTASDFIERIFNNHVGTDNHYETQKGEGWFDERELMGDDDDDIGDLEDYLIRKHLPYYVNKEEKRSKERICKLLGIPYVKPPTCKSKKV
uniref:Importin-beta domain, armadillo-type fold protein n=1 Tax=Tanacetum cinerariifolium TaxID=118510 RepID=A0A6L2NNP9_TANCI|nr:importin-beta domain, armadillo-type fold protein [Tanacetum cinerariifolium]